MEFSAMVIKKDGNQFLEGIVEVLIKIVPIIEK
jgi:hypothetical protein